MIRSISSPATFSNGGRPNTSPAAFPSTSPATFSSNLKRPNTSPSSSLLPLATQLPVGVSPLVASRMRLDATLAPATLALRMNTANLINEMKYNKGKIVSHQFALMKPRRKEVLSKPKGLSDRELSVSRQVARLQKRVEKNFEKNKDKSKAEARQRITGGRRTPSPKDQREARRRSIQDDEQDDDGNDAPRRLSDPSLDIEISRLLDDTRLETVWRSLRGSPPSDEEIAAGAIHGLPRIRAMRALQALGHSSPDQKRLNESLASLPGSGSLDLNEFISVVAIFNRQRRQELKENFRKLDEDCSGTISAREFRHFIWDLGFTVTAEAVAEYLNEADADHSGEVEFAEFEYACQLVHQRHGFSSQEASEFDKLFDRYDTDGSHEMEADELASAMGWLGSPTTLDQAKLIISRFDNDDNGTLAKPEFLMVMRERLEEEISEMQSLFAEFDIACEGSLSIARVIELFTKIGYSITFGVIEDALKQGMPSVYKKGRWKESNLVFENVLQLFHLIRDREGFSDKEMAELTDIFNRHDKTGRGELREFEFARCLNWLGYPLSPHRRRELWCRVDVDKTESIELHEFLKLVRILREEETKGARDALERCREQKLGRSLRAEETEGAGASDKGSEDGLGTHMPPDILKNMLRKLGYSPPTSIIDQAVRQSADSSGDGNLDLQGLLSILRFIREKQVKKLRECAGLSEQHASKIRGKLGLRFDSGRAIEVQDLEKLMHELFPLATLEQIECDKIRALIKQHAKDGIKSLMEAFWIVRLYSDMLDEAQWHHEQDAAREAGFTKWQVASFREAFVAADTNADGVLSEKEIQAVFDDLMSLNLKQIDTMRQEFHRLGDRRECINFAEFLSLMSVILDEEKDQ